MKFFLAIAAAASLAEVSVAFAPSASKPVHSSTALNANVGLYYSTQTGNTETVAGYIAEAAGLEIEDIGDAEDDAVTGLDSIIVGAPTWHTDEESERSGTEWDTWLYDTLPNLDLSGKNVAVFGVGDQASYGEVRERGREIGSGMSYTYFFRLCSPPCWFITFCYISTTPMPPASCTTFSRPRGAR